MKTSELYQKTKILILGLIATFTIISFTSCNKEIPFQKSAVIPAAEGAVKVKQDKNKNYAIQVHVTNLAGADRLSPPKSFYVVWMKSEMNEPRRLGRLNSSNKLKASFETVSQIKPYMIFITAEDNDDVQEPGDLIVLTTGNF